MKSPAASMLSAPMLLSGKKATVWVSDGTADTIWSVIDAGEEILRCASIGKSPGLISMGVMPNT